jgi:hypothetical protein
MVEIKDLQIKDLIKDLNFKIPNKSFDPYNFSLNL